MSKISKLLVMAIVILAVVTMSMKVNAASKADLINYVCGSHTINGVVYEIKNTDKEVVKNYINSSAVTEAQVTAAYTKITQAENLLYSSGAKNTAEIKSSVRAQILSLAQQAANDVGLVLSVDTTPYAGAPYKITTKAGEVIATGNGKAEIANPGVGATGGNGGSSAGAASSSAGTTRRVGSLLYTGSNIAVYSFITVAIVAAAVVVRKRK